MSEGDATEAATASGQVTPDAHVRTRDADALPRVIGPGDWLGRYTVRAEIGAGGMGRVYAATDSELGRSVALKVILPERSASSHARARLLREAQALAQVKHPNVVTIHDVGTEGGHVFLAMELIEGVTLAQWLGGAARPWRTVRDALLAAGRGLVAAHAAGIVHRDFKPQNVIIGDDRVVVVDFGLARAGGEPELETDEPSASNGLHLQLTLTGECIGTPRYMAPEQHAGEPTTEASDQYAFCVVVHEALYGKRPEDRAVAETRGVPRFVAAAIARGLAPRPEDRWPSMAALLAVLGRRFWTRRRTRVALGVGAALVAAIAVVGFTAGRRAAAVASCKSGEAQLAPLWTDATRDQVHAAFRRAGGRDAEAKFAEVDAGMRARLAGWADSYRDNCEATRVRHEQSDAMFDLRAQCLGRVRLKLTSVIDLLRNADARAVNGAPSSVRDGGGSDCADRAALGVAIAPPPPEQAAEVSKLRDELARIEPLFWLGKWPEAATAARDLVARARTLGYQPLLARALATWANIETNTDREDDAIRDFYEAAQIAGAVGDDDLLAKSLPQLGYALGNGKSQFEAAELAHRWAAAAVERAGKTPIRLVTLYGNRAVVLGRRGDHAGALAIYLQLLVAETARSGVSINIAWAHRSVADELGALGRPREATPYYARGVEIGERIYPGDHPLVAGLLADYGYNLVDTFQLDAALQALARARGIYQRTIGPGSVREAVVLTSIASAYLARGQLSEARDAAEAALAIHRAKDAGPTRDAAITMDTLGTIAHRQHKLDEAHALAAEALRLKLAELGPAHEEVGVSYRGDAGHLLALGRVKEARAAIDQALAIHRKANGEQHPYLAEALLVHGDVLRAEHHEHEAIAAYERALAIFEVSHGERSLVLMPALTRLSDALLEAGDLPRAGAFAHRALEIADTRPQGERAATAPHAEVRSARGEDRPAALAQARKSRDALSGLAPK